MSISRADAPKINLVPQTAQLRNQGYSLAAVAASGLMASTAIATAQTWTGANSDSWALGGNWASGAVPAPNSAVIIGRIVPNPTVAAGVPYSTTRTMILGNALADVSNLSLIDGSTFRMGSIRIGENGIGELTLIDSSLFASGNIDLGRLVSGRGSLVLTGPMASLEVLGKISVGTYGTGDFSILDGAKVTSRFGYVADMPASSGTLLVSGQGSLWSVTDRFGVGGDGDATAVIERGGAVTAGGLAGIGFGTTSDSDLTVTGSGSSLTAFALAVGVAGRGDLTVLDGGRVTSTYGAVADALGSYGLVRVNGPGSGWAVAEIGVGGNAAADVFVENGGAVTASVVVGAGLRASSNGRITVTGNGSSLTTPLLELAIVGEGELSILDGGLVTATQSNLATDAGSIAVLRLGAGSGGRGTLETAQIIKGDGSASVVFDGGALRATGDTTDFLKGFADGDVQLLSSGAVVDTNTHDIGISAAMAGVGGLRKEGPGTLVLSGDNNYSGGTSIDAGTLQIGNGGTSGSIMGDVANDGTLAFDRSDATDFGGTISGAGSVEQRGMGQTLLSAANTYLGGTVITAGTLAGTTESFGSGPILNDAALVFDQETDGEIAAAMSGSGTVELFGTGFVGLTGDSSGFSGATTVHDGILSVNGTLGGSLFINQGGRLHGDGTVGGTTIAGTVAPGNSIGTLSVVGDLTFASNGVYEVETGTPGVSDRIDATGQATLNGAAVRVTAFDSSISYLNGRTFTIVQAAGVSGQFSQTVTINSAFLRPTLTYSATDVSLTLAALATPAPDPDPAPTPDPTPQPDPLPEPDPMPTPLNTALPAPQTLFLTVAETRNQIATATALGGLGQTEGSDQIALYNAILFSDAETARWAFDQLSGEGHASLKSALIDESALVRDAVGSRLRSASGRESLSPATGPAINYGNGVTGWGRAFGTWGSVDGDGNAAGTDHDAGGFFVGIDGLTAEGIRLGVVAGYTASDIHVASRAFSAEMDSYTLGLYAATEFSGANLSAGVTHTWHEIGAERTVSVGGFSDWLTSDYGARTAQVFGEVGYKLLAADAVIEPFAGLAYVKLDTDGFRESGGAASLATGGGSTNAAYSTLGVRADTDVAFGSETVRLSGSVAWQHAFVHDVPEATLRFDGGNGFTVGGVPLAGDAALVQAGISIDVMENAAIGLTYGGQFGDGTTRQDARLDLSVRF